MFALDDIDTTNEIDYAMLYALLKGKTFYFILIFLLNCIQYLCF